MDKPDRLLRCKITIHPDGSATARYRWANLNVDGTLAHDEQVGDWDDSEIIDCFADLIDARVLERCARSLRSCP